MNAQPLPMDRDSILERMAEPVWNAYNDHPHGPGPWKVCRTSPHTQESVQEHLADAALALDASGLMERITELEHEVRLHRCGADFQNCQLDKLEVELKRKDEALKRGIFDLNALADQWKVSGLMDTLGLAASFRRATKRLEDALSPTSSDGGGA